MFYDFNRHKRQAASENKAPESRPFRHGLQNLAERIPEKIKMPVLILLISLTGLGFLRLIVDGISADLIPDFSTNQSRQSYRRSPQPFEQYLDSLEHAHIQDSISSSTQNR
ncbi:hypothetical protein Dfri01_68310 [Dyadobacter frigoris]|uniref:hypothetical protein n=1 Tax=Dyadobacter frigoris TaxID=2576211 RepID=UPI0024A1C321|nr:hypothetical protein [Dyadobacter frigoris]GLU57370.1 hypothetical protein Dfri01_68310 [Dyadobacter frigoris]